jgi:hypothetical protein
MKARTPGKWQELVEAVARGETVVSWCQSTGTSYRTAKEWSRTGKFKAEVLAAQTAVLESAIAKLNAASGLLADELVSLSRTARSESTRIAAIQASWENMIKLESHTKLRAEVAELRAEVDRLMETHSVAGKPAGAERRGKCESGD